MNDRRSGSSCRGRAASTISARITKWASDSPVFPLEKRQFLTHAQWHSLWHSVSGTVLAAGSFPAKKPAASAVPLRMFSQSKCHWASAPGLFLDRVRGLTPPGSPEQVRLRFYLVLRFEHLLAFQPVSGKHAS